MLSYDNYRLIPLPLKDYRPDAMDFKMIINPLYRTATYSDNEIIRAVVMDKEYKKIDYFEHEMPGTKPTEMQKVVSYLLPYRVNLKSENSEYYRMHISGISRFSLLSVIVSALVYAVFSFRRREKRRFMLIDSAFILFTGVYGLAAVVLIPYEE